MSKTGASYLNSLVIDQNAEAVQVGSSFVTVDATASPQASPLAFSSAVITIVPPDNAVEFVVAPTAALRVSELVGMGSYDVVAASTKESIPCARMSAIYIKRDV